MLGVGSPCRSYADVSGGSGRGCGRERCRGLRPSLRAPVGTGTAQLPLASVPFSPYSSPLRTCMGCWGEAWNKINKFSLLLSVPALRISARAPEPRGGRVEVLPLAPHASSAPSCAAGTPCLRAVGPRLAWSFFPLALQFGRWGGAASSFPPASSRGARSHPGRWL